MLENKEFSTKCRNILSLNVLEQWTQETHRILRNETREKEGRSIGCCKVRARGTTHKRRKLERRKLPSVYRTKREQMRELESSWCLECGETQCENRCEKNAFARRRHIVATTRKVFSKVRRDRRVRDSLLFWRLSRVLATRSFLLREHARYYYS